MASWIPALNLLASSGMGNLKGTGYGLLGAVILPFCFQVSVVAELPFPSNELARIRSSGMSEEAQRQAEAQVYLDEIWRRGAKAEDVWVNALQEIGLPADQALRIFTDLLASESEAIRKQSIGVLGSNLGPRARAAAPKIISFLEAPHHSEEFYAVAAHALGKIGGPEIIPALINRLDRTPSNHFFLRTNLIDALTIMAPSAQSALPVLKEQLKDPNTFVQFLAFRAIGIIQNRPEPPLSQVLEMPTLRALPDDELYPTFMAIMSSSSKSSALVPLILKVVEQDPRRYLKCMGLQVLGAAGTGNADAIRALIDAVGSNDDWISMLGCQGLTQVQSSESAVSSLAQALEHPNVKVRCQAAITLKQFGPAAAPAAVSLAGALARSDHRTSDREIGAYLEALKSTGFSASSASDTLVSLLAETSPIYRNRSEYVTHHLQAFILATLAEIGVPKSTLPFILNSLANSDDRNAVLFAAAARAAGKLGPDASIAVPFLLRALKGEIFDGRFNFDTFLRHSGNAPTTSCLREALEALVKMGPAARAALPVLNEFITRHDPQQARGSSAFSARFFYEEAREAYKAIEQ